MHRVWPGLCILFLLVASELHAAPADARFTIMLNHDESIGLKLQAAVDLAAPQLWRRVVPLKDLQKVQRLSVPTSLLLQFKSTDKGARLVFNPNQVRIFLRRHQIDMILKYPYWNLSIDALGFAGSNDALSRRLLGYSNNKAMDLGFRLGSRGKKLQLMFTPAVDAAREDVIHVDVEGALSPGLLSQTDIKVNGDARRQLETFLTQILFEFRDAYRFEALTFKETTHEILLTVNSDYTLATQVMLEQALRRNPQVVGMVPVTLQKTSRQYRIQLRDHQSAWIGSWFAGYGLKAVRQQAGGSTEWFVQ